MKKLKLYLDTSTISFALADDIAEEERETTKELFEQINKGAYEGFISEIVIREISNTSDSVKKDKLTKFLNSIEFSDILEVNEEVNTLAERYVSENIIPAKHMDDALHIALASVNDIDIVVSWNFKHMVKHKTRVEVLGVNALLGYKTVDICTPKEVIEDV